MIDRWSGRLAAAAALASALVAFSAWRGQDRLAARAVATERVLETMLSQQRQLAAALETGLARRHTSVVAAAGCAPAAPDVAAARVASAASDTGPEAATDVPEEADPRVVQVRAEAWVAVEGVLSRGVWTEEDRLRHGPLFRSLDDAERMRILTALADAMNRGELEPSAIDFL